MRESGRRYFIVKHDLSSLKALPGFIWRTDLGSRTLPPGFRRVRKGDRWIAFAYTTSDARERPLSLVTGFYECTRAAEFRPAPRFRRGYEGEGDEPDSFWQIKGKRYGRQPAWPVGVRPLDSLLGRTTFKQSALTDITESEFEAIRKEVLQLEFDSRNIPVIGREPECEQEVLGIVVAAHKAIGVRKILRIRKAFPDMLVEIEGRRNPVHLELELYSSGFMAHGHNRQVRRRAFGEDRKPIAVLCWIDDDKRARPFVHRVYELQALIRKGKKIAW